MSVYLSQASWEVNLDLSNLAWVGVKGAFLFQMSSAKYKTKTQEISTGLCSRKQKNLTEIRVGRLVQHVELSAPYEILLKR